MTEQPRSFASFKVKWGEGVVSLVPAACAQQLIYPLWPAYGRPLGSISEPSPALTLVLIFTAWLLIVRSGLSVWVPPTATAGFDTRFRFH